VDELKTALKDNDTAAIRTATDKVAQSSQKMGAAMYANAQAADAGPSSADAYGAGGGDAASGGTSSSDTSDDDVVEAEIVDEDERK
jgi:molecular chaperone DnaK